MTRTKEPGHLYAARSLDGVWIKVGFSTCLQDRLKAINHEYSIGGRLSLIGATPSVFRAEQQIHRCLRPFLQGKQTQGRELYPAVPSLESVVSIVVSGRDRPPLDLDDYLDLARWCRSEARQPHNKLPALAAHSAIAEWRREQWLAFKARVAA
jgi:hypothetical protein